MPNTNIGKLISMLFTTGRLIKERTGSQDGVDPFSYLRLETLRFISESGGVAMRDIAYHLRITPPSATSLINGLVKSGQLNRTQDKEDRRVVLLKITPKGEKILATEFKKITKRMEKIFSKLDEKEIKDFIRILEKLSEVYKK
jgi:DNA-binding MarR family transcriptional regulator